MSWLFNLAETAVAPALRTNGHIITRWRIVVLINEMVHDGPAVATTPKALNLFNTHL
jgi:hypothetical protein